MSDTPAICDICKRPIDESWSERGWCSDYCCEISDSDRQLYLNAQIGEICPWPCWECGCIVWGPLVPPANVDACCTPCSPYRKLRFAKDMLGELVPHLPKDLRVMVMDLLEKI